MAASKTRHLDLLLQECDADIRAGQSHQVGRRLAQIGTSKIPQSYRLPLAKICRRAGLYSLGLRLLTRLVSSSPAKASSAELAEYSALLIRSGAVEEALNNLERVNFNDAPEAFLIRAFALFSRWEYDEAIPNLENYLKTPLSDSELLVGRSNLALALVESRRHDLARNKLEENIRMAKQQGYTHLEVYNTSLLAQVYLQEGDFAGARRLMKSAAPNDLKSQSNSDWSTLKLKLVLDGLEHKDLRPLLKLRELAVLKKDWSAIRDADLYLLKIDFKEEAFLHLYFGSPLAGFRNRIRQELGRRPEQKNFVLGKKSAPCFDLETGQVDGKTIIRPGLRSHKLISALLWDFYQPMRVGGLYAALFPENHFNISSSPGRVHQIVRRTRRWLIEHRIPVLIQEREGFYSLYIDGDFSFRIPIDRQPKDLFNQRIHQLMTAFPGGKLFTTHDIQNELGLSITSVHRLLQHGIESEKIERLGKTKRPSGYRIRGVVSKSNVLA